MDIIKKSIGELIGYDKNARTHSDDQIQEIANSIENFGFNDPIEIGPDNVIISGHARMAAALKLGLDEVPVIVHSHMNKKNRKAYVLAANRIAMSSSWDYDLLKDELIDLNDEDFNLSLTGFTDDEINDILDLDEVAENLADEDDCPGVPEEPITKLGDVWLLGKHRLMCGSSVMIDNVDKLMNGEKADMFFCDPPYGINEKTDRDLASRTRSAKAGKFNKIIGDESIDTAVDAYYLCNGLSDIICYWGGNYYANKLPSSPCWIVWDKRVDDSQRDMNSDCELAYVKHPNKKSVRIFRHLWKGMIKASEHGQSRVHPTQKPVALAEWCIKELNPKGESVVDLFGGSGSTLIACEKLKRKCYTMELEPKYVSVIIQRWMIFTGKMAYLINGDGSQSSWNDVYAER